MAEEQNKWQKLGSQALFGGKLGSDIYNQFFTEDMQSRLEGMSLQDYERNPRLDRTQAFGEDYYRNLLEGKPNDYYGLIGALDSPEIQSFKDMNIRDIMKGTNEQSAAMGRGGGRATDIASKRVADYSTGFDYQNLLGARQGRLSLLGVGKEGFSDVGSKALSREGALNQYNLSRYGYDIDKAKGLDEFYMTQEQAKGESDAGFWGDLLENPLVRGGLGVATGGASEMAYMAKDWGEIFSAGANKAGKNATMDAIKKRNNY